MSKSKGQENTEKGEVENINDKLNKMIAYNNIDNNELREHLYLIKKWLKEYNQFEYDNQSLGKFTKYIKKVEDIKIVLNHKLNFCHTKILIDYLELKIRCPSFAKEFRTNFIRYISYVNALIRRILISSKKILEDTSVFNDLVLFNYPYIYSFDNKNNYELFKSDRRIISFGKCFVVEVNSPIFLLWAKKEYPACSCDIENKKSHNKKYFNIFSQNLKYNSNFSRSSICKKCGEPYYHDTKGDIYIQSQEIKLVLDCTNSLFPNVISVWSFGDLINSVQEGDCITLNAFHVPEKLNTFEKNYINGYFVALNYDKFFNNLHLLRPSDFKLTLNNAQENLADKLKNIKIKENNCDAFDNIFFDGEEKINEDSFEEILQSLKFQRQTCESFFKLIIQNYIHFKQKELNNLDSGFGSSAESGTIAFPKINENYYPFINLILDISITQRDYYNHHIKICFFENENDENENEESQESNHLKELTQSRNILFKKRMFNKRNDFKNEGDKHQNKGINTYISNKFDKMETRSTLDFDIQNYFELIHQINNVSNLANDLLTKPIHLFLIFDSVKNDPLFNNIIMKYATKLYPDLIKIFPIHNQVKWTQQELMNYFYSNNNSIILIQDIELLSKLEIEIISNIMNSNNNNSLNITFWFLCSFSLLMENNINNKKNKNNMSGYLINDMSFNNTKIKIKGFENILEKCEIIMNYSIRNLRYINNISLINDNSIINFLIDSNEGEIKEEKLLEFYHYSEFVNNKLNIYCNKNHLYSGYDNSSLNSSKIIEKYFINKRNMAKINFDDLFTLLRLSIFFSMLRFHYENKKISLPITISNINYIDALNSILIYEHISQYKYGLESKIMSNITESLLFQDYNKIIDEVMNNIMLQEQNNIPVKNNKLDMNFNLSKEKIEYFGDDCIPSKSINNKRIKLDNNTLNDNSFFEGKMLTKKNDIEECKLCSQINNLNVEHKKFLIDYLNKLNEFILKE